MEVRAGTDWLPWREELLAGAREFAPVLEQAPFRNAHGLRGVSAFALWWFLRRLEPSVVFEVGVWRGFSTWLIEQAVPDAELHCFDPMFFLEPWMHKRKVGRVYRSTRARYWTSEFSCSDIAGIAAAHDRPAAFFDDHQNKLPRLRQARQAGIHDLIFDDNMCDAGTHRTLEDDRQDSAGRARLELEIERYEIFPALWPVDFAPGDLRTSEPGLGFPVEDRLSAVYDERRWHSSVTYVGLRSDAA